MILKKVVFACLMPVVAVMLLAVPSTANEQGRQMELIETGSINKRDKPLTMSASQVIDSLRSNDPPATSKACKALKVDCGKIGFSSVRVILPCCSKKLRSLTLIGISWEGPVNGYLLLISASGKVIDKKQVGYINAVGTRPLLSDGDDVIVVDSKVGAGTGISESNYSIFKISEVGLKKLWENISHVTSFPLLAAPENNYEIRGSLDFKDVERDGMQEIFYTSITTKYLYDLQLDELKPVETEQDTKIYQLKDDKYLLRTNVE